MTRRPRGRYPWRAGVWAQDDDPDRELVEWSRHATERAAVRAAVRYARAQRQATGGRLSWAGGVESPQGCRRWYDGHGEEVS